MKRLGYGGAALVPMAVSIICRKCLSMNEKVVVLKDGFKCIPRGWGLRALWGRVLVCNFM